MQIGRSMDAEREARCSRLYADAPGRSASGLVVDDTQDSVSTSTAVPDAQYTQIINKHR